jgi:hypothetical protein
VRKLNDNLGRDTYVPAVWRILNKFAIKIVSVPQFGPASIEYRNIARLVAPLRDNRSYICVDDNNLFSATEAHGGDTGSRRTYLWINRMHENIRHKGPRLRFISRERRTHNWQTDRRLIGKRIASRAKQFANNELKFRFG